MREVERSIEHPIRLPVEVDGESLLALARADTDQARERLRQLPVEALAAGLHDLRPQRRVEFLELAERVEEIVPLLSEAELTSTIRETGLADAGWLIEFASSEQRVAAVDLDCWKDHRFSPSRFYEWLDAMVEAGPETLAAAFFELDLEVWILALKQMGDFAIVGAGEEADGDYVTDDGMVYYTPHTAENEERLREILWTARLYAPSVYWVFVYGAMTKSEHECELFAARWHRGRLNDLGFPDREQAMRAYRPLRVDAAPVTDIGHDAAPESALARSASLPQRLAGTLVGRALSELPAHRAGEILGYVLAVANTLAVADELPLSESGSVDSSFSKAIRGIDRGLEELAKANSLSAATVLDQTVPLDLFRIGATLDSQLGRRRTIADLEEDLGRSDWNVETQMVAAEDQTIGPDGRPT